MSQSKEAKPSAPTQTAAPSPAPAASPPSTTAPLTNDQLLEATLYRLTHGLPRHELNLMISEADECETSLQQEIALMEKAVSSQQQLTPEETTALQNLLQSPLTPMDRYWTASSLLGRLRDEWTMPSILLAMEDSNDDHVFTATPPPPKAAQAALQMVAHPAYTRQHTQPTALLAVYKKIAMHKSSSVFKRAVKPEEAPGYTDRIVFPMDLGMIRKFIVSSRQIHSFSDLHKFIGLIAHNCVKYNGRESDYGRVAREFEAAAEELIRQAVMEQPLTTVAVATTTTTKTTSRPNSTTAQQGLPTNTARAAVAMTKTVAEKSS